MFSNPNRPVPRRQAIGLLSGGAFFARFAWLFALSGPVLAPPAIAQAAGVGTVRGITGPGRVGKAEPLPAMQPGMSIFLGDRAVTGEEGRAHLGLGRATEIHLGPKSELRIDEFLASAGGVIHLDGALVFDRPDAKTEPALEIQTEYGRIGVRGTRFFAGREGDGFSVFVERGSVTVAAAGSIVRVLAGQGTQIAAIGAPPAIPDRWTDDRVATVFADVLGAAP